MENNNSNQHPISNNIKQKRNFFHRHLDGLHSILKKMHRKFEGNRPIRKKVMLFQRMDWNAIHDLPFSQAGRKTLAYKTVNNVKTRIWTFLVVSSLLQVFASFCPLSSPILPYPYLFTRWPHRLVCSTHVNTMLLTLASLREQQCFGFH